MAATEGSLLSSISELFDTGEYSDLTITCGQDTYKVHKAIVCKRCDFFKRAISFGGKETQNGIVDLPEDDPGTIRRLIQYLYSGSYNIPKTKKTNEMVHGRRPVANRDGVAFTYHFPHTCNSNDPPIVHVCPHHTCANRCDYRRPGYNKFAANFSCEDCIASKFSLGTEEALIVHAQLYAVADKYAVLGLNKCAAQSFKDACKFFWDSPTFAKVARQVFADTPENDKGLREIVIKTIANHMILNKKPEIKALMLEFSSLCYGVLVETHADKDFFV